MSFVLTDQPICTQERKQNLEALEAGAYVEFEGRVRNHSQGRVVRRLDYEAYHDLAESEGDALLRDAADRFDIIDAAAVHRVGRLALGEVAVWIGVVAAHRADAFRACAFCIDEIKKRLPIWKREVYANGDAEWINGCDHGSSDPYAREASATGEPAP
jgi:molybdopterin synthase catalytic subunit